MCTHNSRRSQLCQVWGSILSKIYNIDLKFNSAGTEKTEVFKTVFYCFSNVGVEIKDSKIFYRDLSLSLVPTMGNLHQGHTSLIHLAQQNSQKVMVSILKS